MQTFKFTQIGFLSVAPFPTCGLRTVLSGRVKCACTCTHVLHYVGKSHEDGFFKIDNFGRFTLASTEKAHISSDGKLSDFLAYFTWIQEKWHVARRDSKPGIHVADEGPGLLRRTQKRPCFLRSRRRFDKRMFVLQTDFY